MQTAERLARYPSKVAWILIPAALLMAAIAGLALGLEPLPLWFYQCVWWPYILLADAVHERLGGDSLIRRRPRRFLWLCWGSVVWWTLFEAINLRLGNWYYVMTQPDQASRWLAGFAAFSTVLPGTLVTLALLENRGWPRSVRVSRLSWGPVKESCCLALGVGCLVLPLIWPDVFFPLTWGSFVFLMAPWNRRHARRSFLRDLEAGEAGPFIRTLLAGLLCGLIWESANFWARTRWIYTVPGFEELKLFEMPLLGFLGFPPFAVECVVLVRFVAAVWRRTLSWPASRRRALAGVALLAGTAATLVVFELSEPITSDSHYVPVSRLEVLPAADRLALSRNGLQVPERLVVELEDPRRLSEWSALTGLSAEVLREHRDRVELAVHRGLGERRALQLEALGIHSLADLARWRPGPLAAALRERTGAPDPFLERRARIWIQGPPASP